MEKIEELLTEIRDELKKMNDEKFADLYREMREIKVRLMDVMK